MSTLVDHIIAERETSVEIGGLWYSARPLNRTKRYTPLSARIADAWRVLCGKSIAVHYKESEAQP